MRPLCSPVTASLSEGSPATWVRAGPARDTVPLLTEAAEWAAIVGAYRDGAEWAELALEHADEQQPPVLLRCGRSYSTRPAEVRGDAAYAEAIEVALGVPRGGQNPGRQGGARRRAAGRPKIWAG